MAQAIFPRRFPTALLVALIGLAGCKPAPEKATEQASPLAVATGAPVLPKPVLNRADLLGAIAAARTGYAAGADTPSPSAESLVGRRFSLRLAFGCSGPMEQDAEGLARWNWDSNRRAIDLRMTPADWTATPLMAEPGAPWEAVEGFWLTRPWLLADSCPRVPVELAPVDAPATNAGPAARAAVPSAAVAPAIVQTAGLAAVFKKDSSRVGRRDGRAFTATVRGEPLPEPPLGGYRLVIEGRFSAFSAGRAIRCRGANPDAEPICVAAAEIDRVAFEDAAGKLVREWRPGS